VGDKPTSHARIGRILGTSNAKGTPLGCLSSSSNHSVSLDREEIPPFLHLSLEPLDAPTVNDPARGGSLIGPIKDSSLVSVPSYGELTRASRSMRCRSVPIRTPSVA
jgi:hypothetical protein